MGKAQCAHCGATLALGAMACFRCGRLIVFEGSPVGSRGPELPTGLGTVVRESLLEGRWLLKQPLGGGQTSVVWRARDLTFDRDVAVKVLNPERSSDPAAIERFGREARLLARLEHRNLVMLLATGVHQGQPFLVMNLLVGATLAEHLHRRGGRLPAAEACALLVPLCEVLQTLHQAGVVHRGLQPRHVHVGEGGAVTLLDLGQAREPGSELTRSGELMGEVGYQAPEVVAGAKADERADVYSLGCLAYELLSGRLPFAGEPTALVMAGTALLAAPRLSVVAPAVEAALAEVVERAVAANRDERFASVVELRAALLPFVGSAVVAPPLVVPTSRVGQPGPSPEELPTLESAAQVPAPGALFERAEVVTAPMPAHRPQGLQFSMAAHSVAGAEERPSDRTVIKPMPVRSPSAEGDTTAPRAVPAPLAGTGERREPSSSAAPLAAVSALGVALFVAGLYVAAMSRPGPAPDGPVPLPRSIIEGALSVAPPPAPMLEIPRTVSDETQRRIDQLSGVGSSAGARERRPPALRAGVGRSPMAVRLRTERLVPENLVASVELTTPIHDQKTARDVPAQARVEVDGVFKGVTGRLPLRLELAPGEHVFRVDGPGPLIQTILGFARGEHVKLEIELRNQDEAKLAANPPAKNAVRE